MKTDRKQTTSVWMQTEHIFVAAGLMQDAEVDVCIVGAGIAGISTAYLLLREGKSVIVLDDGPVGGGQTQRTTAHLSNAIDDRYVEIERLHGKEGARLAAASHTAAIDRIESLVRAENIACDFERLDGFLFSPSGESRELLQNELAAAQRAGLTQVEQIDRAPLAGFDTGPCLRFPQQGQFHPLKYLRGLSSAILRMGGRIYSQTHVTGIEPGQPARVRTQSGTLIKAGAVVVATNSPINDWLTIHTKQAPYTTYVVGFRVPHGAVAPGLYWDTQDPYHYVRLQRMEAADPLISGDDREEVLIVGGEDHKTGQADDAEARFDRLEQWTRARFPVSSAAQFRWSGQVMETQDGLAFIGRNPLDKDNIYIATGDSGMGMTHGTIAGMLLTDLILGRFNPWSELYNPARKRVGAAATFAGENLNVALQYGAWMTPGDVSSTTEIPPGCGAIVRQGLTKVAALRDEGGTLHELSAVCPHLGCIVQWNHSENTWDCPCHGSRFDRLGHVISGPANADLETLAGHPATVGAS